ncbi:hypothetical protein BgiMline_030488 [Biomphalaria glabrata]|uniref:Uncharacterized protein LOC106071902 n=1 Tax=Biomphalaria glabrata TaxID=6526 RepID=A0A2C9M700_BIOGL|nr:uncharacterized protein LOC106071902 [Biomphalaria glabrata]KAI8734491.1 hypothetical protein BgiMline_027805 [Biomphalaria glabrata]KAI8775131.1 hypothetical protein BgiBS90_023607 [Biomphalaria glabrata]
MENNRQCRVSVDSVEIFRKKRPHSPSRSKMYVTERKEMPQQRQATKRYSVAEASEEASGKSIFDASIKPVNTVGDGSHPKDFTHQVRATDIAEPHSTQTGPSLRERSAQLPKRCSDRVRCKSGRRSWNHCCDTPRACCGNKICSGEPKDFQIQADPREIGSSESVQTGPSLAASGSFCRFDYKLRKVKKWPADSSQQCDCPKKQEYHVSCAENREGCGAFHQQVKSTDIQSSDVVQTGQSGQCTEGDIILYGTAKRQPTKAYKRHNSSDDYVWCECMRVKGTEGQSHVGTQVAATNISPSKCIQTDRCLANACLTGRKIRNTDWDDCRCSSAKGAPGGSGKKRTISQAVKPLDISDCTEMQTESSLDLTEVYTRKREVCPGSQRSGDIIRYGRARDICDDCVQIRVKIPKNARLTERSTQVEGRNINVEDGNQTVECCGTCDCN